MACPCALWCMANTGDLVNLGAASRVYVDRRGRLMATFVEGDVQILGPGTGSDPGVAARAAMLLIMAQMPGYAAFSFAPAEGGGMGLAVPVQGPATSVVR